MTAPGGAATRVAPHGAWASPLSAAAAAEGASRCSGLAVTRDDAGVATVWWSETRPSEQGRVALVGVRGDEPPVDLEPGRVRLRSRVNEYGGGAFWCGDGHVDWVDDTTQRVCRAELIEGPSAARLLPDPITEVPPGRLAWRYASGCPVGGGEWVVCERESHTDDDGAPYVEPRNEVVAVHAADRRQWVLVGAGGHGGGDFVAAPTVSPDGALVAWLRWDHPHMPWDAAELWVGRLELPGAGGAGAGARPSVVERRRVAGGPAGGAALGLDRAVSVCLPQWSPDGRLWWCDDADGWWHLRVAPAVGLPEAAAGDDPSTAVPGGGEPGEEVGEPRWVAGGRRYAFCGDGTVVMAVASGGLDSLWLLDPATGTRSALPGPQLRAIELVAAEGSTVAVVGGTADRPTTVWRHELDGAAGEGPSVGPIELRPVSPPLGPAWVSLPTPVTFPTGRPSRSDEVGDDGGVDMPVAHALVYLPASGDHVGPPGELPPLVVRIHGGPTAAARPEFSTSVQFWTTRGVAVADVNYRGSTGFGRDYRDQLRGAWGVADVEDCIAVTRHLADEGLVDGRRCVIRGGSAGGFTALAAVCFQSDWGAEGAFAAACSLYGVTDLASLAADTHKFESRYLDGLVAPLPEGAAVYRQRSPLFHAERLSSPVLLLQGSEDKVVPPAQAEVLVAALEANGVPHRYVLFQGEGHGFHLAETIVAALTAELEFYGEVLGFEPG
jgi:dipeptidyl aminopeptidase/acylaminoacyl peptidase